MMKKLLFTLATAIVLALPACGQNAKKQKNEMKTLVAYFSATYSLRSGLPDGFCCVQ